MQHAARFTAHEESACRVLATQALHGVMASDAYVARRHLSAAHSPPLPAVDKTEMSETKKESFRKYLEASGVIDSLTKVLVGLYEEPEKPANAVDTVVKLLGAPSVDEYNALLAERDELQDRLRQVEDELAQIKGEAQ
eukprot:jgi/Tetstr1/422206/TSEL_013058.t1